MKHVHPRSPQRLALIALCLAASARLLVAVNVTTNKDAADYTVSDDWTDGTPAGNTLIINNTGVFLNDSSVSDTIVAIYIRGGYDFTFTAGTLTTSASNPAYHVGRSGGGSGTSVLNINGGTLISTTTSATGKSLVIGDTYSGIVNVSAGMFDGKAIIYVSNGTTTGALNISGTGVVNTRDLVVSNSTGAGSVNLTGGTLNVTGALTVNAAGSLTLNSAASASVGTLSLDASAGFTYGLLNGSTKALHVTTTVFNGNTLTLDFKDFTGDLSSFDANAVFDFGSITGSVLVETVNTGAYDVDITYNGVTFVTVVTAIPEPATTALLLALVTALFLFHHKGRKGFLKGHKAPNPLNRR